MGDSYDDRMETMLVTRRRVAEQRKVSRQQELQKQIAAGIVALATLIFVIVLLVQGCGNDDVNTTKQQVTTAPKVTLESENVTPAEGNTEAVETTSNVRYTTDVLNFRAEANTESEVLMQIPMGAKVKLIDNDGEWCKIKYKKKEGYVKFEFLSETKPESE